MKKIILLILLITQTLYASYNPNMAISDDKLTETNCVYKSNGMQLVKGTLYDTGNIGIGTKIPSSPLTIQKDGTLSGLAQLTIKGATNANEQLLIGFDSSDYGFIQSIEQGVAYRPLLLNRDGGNIGIGTTSPEEKLTVAGYIRASSGYKIGSNDINTAGTLSSVAYKNQTNTFSANQIINGNLTGVVSLVANQDIVLNSSSNGQEMFRFTEAGSASNAALYMKYNGTTSINFNASSSSNSYFNAGNLGIGTTSPSDKLNIIGDTAKGLTIGGLVAGIGQWSPTIRLVGRMKTFYIQERDEESRFVIGHTTPNTANELFTIRYTGNVGIGTTSPSEKLEVVGDIKAGNIKSGGWIRGSEEGQILKMIMQNVTGTAVSVNSTNWTVVASMSYTPVSSSSYVLVEFNTRYDIPGSGSDSFLSRITVGGTQIVYSRQNFINVAGGGSRGSVLFPLMGWYTNSATSALTINAEIKWESTDDTLTSYRDGSTWFKITEIARGYYM